VLLAGNVLKARPVRSRSSIQRVVCLETMPRGCFSERARGINVVRHRLHEPRFHQPLESLFGRSLIMSTLNVRSCSKWRGFRRSQRARNASHLPSKIEYLVILCSEIGCLPRRQPRLARLRWQRRDIVLGLGRKRSASDAKICTETSIAFENSALH
jgi:hypothetical protein